MACSLRGSRILVDFVVNSLHKIARGRGTLNVRAEFKCNHPFDTWPRPLGVRSTQWATDRQEQRAIVEVVRLFAVLHDSQSSRWRGPGPRPARGVTFRDPPRGDLRRVHDGTDPLFGLG
jgi:hypothetical protein